MDLGPGRHHSGAGLVSAARDDLLPMAVMCDWTVAPSPLNPEGTTRMERGAQRIVVHWHPAGAMKGATLYLGEAVAEELRKDDKDRRRKMEAWLKSAPVLTSVVTGE